MKREFGGYLMNHDTNRELVHTSLEEEAEVLVIYYFLTFRTHIPCHDTQLTLVVVEEMLEHFMDPVNGSNAKGRKPTGMCLLFTC